MAALVILGVVVVAVGAIVLVHHRGSAAAPVHQDPATKSAPTTSPVSTTATTTTTPPAPSPLGATVNSYVSSRSGDLTAAVEDLDTGQSWTLDPGEAEATASIVKVDIMEALLAQETKEGPLPASEQDALTPMIEQSDNDSATALWQAAGSAAGIGAYNDTIGLTGTMPSPCLTCAGFEWPGWGLTTTTATDQLALLAHLVLPNDEVGSAERNEGLLLMENVDADERWGVSTGVPAGVTVALKNGWVPLQDGLWQINTMGWVDGDGRNYLIALLDDGNPDESYGIDTVDQVSQLVWTALAPS